MINKGRDRGITQERFHREVWKEVVWNIDFRMRYNDPLIVLDSQAMYSKDMEHYRFMVSKYGYDAYVVDCYSDVGLDTCLKRNAEKAFPRPEWLITRFFETVEHEKIPDFYLDEVSRQDAKMIIKEALKHCDPDS
jgi:predicted kinase